MQSICARVHTQSEVHNTPILSTKSVQKQKYYDSGRQETTQLKCRYHTVRDNDNLKSHKYVCLTTYQPDTKSNSNPNPNPNPILLNNTQ